MYTVFVFKMGGSAAKVNDAIQKRDDKWAEEGPPQARKIMEEDVLVLEGAA